MPPKKARVDDGKHNDDNAAFHGQYMGCLQFWYSMFVFVLGGAGFLHPVRNFILFSLDS